MAFSEAPGRARRMVRSQDIIWATVRPNLRAFALIIDPEINTVASTGFAVITPKNLPYTYLYCNLTTDSFTDYLVNHTTGSAYPAVNQNDFKKAPVIVPDEKIIRLFHDLTYSFWSHVHVLMKRNINLRQTRDLLLPKLISGEIDVSEMPTPEEIAA
jgi:type I restriction enzyme S subunit